MLQARIFSYADAQRHRLGTHYEALPVNAPKCPVNHYRKDGHMRFSPNNPNPDAYFEKVYPDYAAGVRKALADLGYVTHS